MKYDFMNKKSQGLSLTTIIIAVIVIVVLVVLVYVFTGGAGKFREDVISCRGECIPRNECQVVAPEGEGECGDARRENRFGFSGPAPETILEGGTVCCLIKNEKS